MIFPVVTSIIALFIAFILVLRILKKKIGSKKAEQLSKKIQQGAAIFLNKEYKILSLFVVIVSIILYILISPLSAGIFILGAISSGLSGRIGMYIATRSNARTAELCKDDTKKGLKLAFSSGAVMGLCVAGLGLLSLSILFYVFKDPTILYAFGFGASSIALFARIAGGVYTKAADMGADIVGKIEEKIPEDDPRNPGVIADQVGDNVGDVAGMGADLFESYVDSIIAAMVMATVSVGITGSALPLFLAAIGIITSIIGMLFVQKNMTSGILISSLLTIICAYFLVSYMGLDLGIFYSIAMGLIGGLIIGLSANYYTSYSYKPTQKIAQASKTGAATNVVAGISTGMFSTIIPIITIGTIMLLAYHFSNLFGIGIAAVGMLSTLGITLAMDCYGPVADNAAGIAEMSSMGKKARENAEKLDAIGNSTAAIGKGFAIGSAALTALALFSTFTNIFNISISLTSPQVVTGLFIGALLPFVFSSLTMNAVSRTAEKMIEEIRRQFKNKKILKGKKEPDYNRCIGISTEAAIKEMILPTLIAILSPLIIGLLIGPEALGGLLAGSISTGFLLAVTFANSGGAMDNAKKFIESGKLGGKGSNSHKNAVVGDTVGDSMKDCSGPSLNILIKLMTIVALLFAPLIL